VIGAGSVATRHARVLSGFDDAEIVAVHDAHRPAAELVGTTYGFPVAGDLAAVLRAGPDAVWLPHCPPRPATTGATSTRWPAPATR
jgi:predicted dehydrogenase